MDKSYDRREFLRKGSRGLAAAAALGMTGGLLDACSSLPSAAKRSTTTLGPSGVTDRRPPKSGGSMTIGTWSEVASLSPPSATWDATGYLYGNAIFDTLVQIGADGKPHPYLASAFSPNPDYTEWTFTIRSGIEFQSGEALDAAAVVNCLEAVWHGLVTSQTLKPVTSIAATGPMTVRIIVDQPWPAFASYLAGQIGYICSPKMLRSTNQGADHPIGTGPFYFEEWVPNSHLSLKRNPRYWQSGRPYLDRLTFRPIIDNSTRAAALESGTISVMHCQAPQTIKTFFNNSKYQVIVGTLPNRAEPDMDFIMLNLESPPLDDIRVRKALALSIDKTVLRSTYGADLTAFSTGPFVPGEIWYGPTGYPGHDITEAKRLIEEYKHEKGSYPTLSFTTIEGPDYLEIADIVQASWKKVNVTTNISQLNFADFVDDAVLGRFQACTFEQFGATDPDQNYIWWSTDTVGPIGAISLNMARNKDSRIQRELTIGRQSTSLATRAEAYQKVSKYLAEDLPYLWLDATYWAACATADVVGVTGQTLPDGEKSIGFNGGAFLVQQLAFSN